MCATAVTESSLESCWVNRISPGIGGGGIGWLSSWVVGWLGNWVAG